MSTYPLDERTTTDPRSGPNASNGLWSGQMGTKLDGIQLKVFLDRYALKDRDGQPLEEYPEQMWERVAQGIAAVEAGPEQQARWAGEFYRAMAGFRFVPGGRILAGAGSGHAVTFFNCHVLPSPEDSRGGILDNLKLMTEVMARGGGVGINLSSVRPRGSYIKTVNGTASGPVSWAELYSVATGDVIQQGGTRMGALMLMLNDYHPDVEEFITIKRDHRKLTHANLSVAISDAFMDAVKADADWKLVWQGEVKRVVRARYLWDLICQSAWESGEPGVVFMDRYNQLSNTWYYERVVSVNPCVTGDTLVATEAGYVRARDLKAGVRILTPECLKPIARVYNNGIQRIYRVSCSDGGHLDCTADHKLRVVREGKHEWVAVRDLRVGNRIAVATNGVFGEGQGRESMRARDTWEHAGDSWTTSVVSVHDTGRNEEVFDVYEPETLTWVANGYVSLDCGEQGLPAWGVCNLGALSLATFVEAGQLDYDGLARHARVAVRFLDDVIDASEYFLDEMREVQMGSRRIGLGTMGLADALITLKLRYGSDESLRVIDRIYQTIRDAAYEASCDLAVEKGAFPRLDREKYLQGTFIQRLPEELQGRIRRDGNRNAVLLTQAPTGTTSLLAGASSGIEPVYDFLMRRRDRTGEHVLYHPLFAEWREAHPDDTIPDYFVSAGELTPEEHVRVQAAIQAHVDASLSKTVNSPQSHTVADVKSLYTLAYDLGCKGITYFRDGSREGVLSHVDEDKTKSEPRPTPANQAPAQPRPRPQVLSGRTYRVKTPVGTAFVTVNDDEGGQPFEVFVTVGKGGSDLAADAEALGRLISLALRIPSNSSARSVAEAVVDQLVGIGGSGSLGFGPNRVRSLADAVAKALVEHLRVCGDGGHCGADPGGDTSGDSAAPSAEAGGVGLARLTGDFCPSCGQLSLIFEEGCRKCRGCGFSSC